MAIPLRSPAPGAPSRRAPLNVPEIPDRVAGTEDRPEALAALLAAADEGEREQAWGRFLEDYSDVRLRSACGSRLGYDDAMDRYAFVLDQLRASNFRRLRRFQPRGSARFTTWLVLVARRLCLDHRRHRYGRRPVSDGSAKAEARAVRRRLADLVGEHVDVADLTDDASAGPEATLAADERRRVVELALTGLEPRVRLLLVLRFGRGLTAREIGDLMGYPSQFHVFRHLRTVLATVRQSMIQAGVEGPGI